MFNPFLTFSDSAKYAEAAKNWLSSGNLGVHHSFFDINTLQHYQPGQSFSVYFLPFVPRFLAEVFRFLPANDSTMALVGSVGLVLIWLLTFLIAKKLHSTKAGLVSLALMASSLFFWEYARNATTEIFFTLEILLFIYLILINKITRIIAVVVFVLMFATRQQAIIILGSLVLTSLLFFISSKWPTKTKLKGLGVVALVAVIAIGFSILNPNSIFSPMKVLGALNISANSAQGQYLRGGAYDFSGPKVLISKTIYNFYNYLKTPERLATPVAFVFFILGLFLSFKRSETKWFFIFTLITLTLMLLGASATLPNARYVHPVIPLVVIAAGITLAEVINKLKPKYSQITLISLLMFVTLPTIGYFTLDARFRGQEFNTNKPPVYKVISDIMAQDIPQNKLIITNLDAWAAWYRGLTTMWFPLSPDLLIPTKGGDNHADYIVITNYLEHDADFVLGPWKEVVYTPDKISNMFLKDNYQVLKTFTINPSEDYEKQEIKGTILVKK